MGLDYLRDPEEIYRRSFALVRDEADLARFVGPDAEVAMRMIHACGQVDIAGDLVFSGDASKAGTDALKAGKPVFCDAEMVAAGINRSRLAAGNDVICTLDAPGLAEAAKKARTTRSAAAVDLWDERLAGAIVAIGNAPTALFRLLERLDAGAPKPALIVGLPVGFVGAAESKAELIADSRGVPYLTLVGRFGGSALAAAAINALASLAWPKP
ncbi:MAG: precorrin-8X methylmutase [Alphaproteobacteria bacterium]|nr:precorrin-8X methylmutase [Alphaproteobacteria bacterium]